MPNANICHLIGHVGKDAERTATQGGTSVARFSLATSYKNGEREKTEWHRVVLFGKLADAVGDYITKGKAVYVQGRIEYRSWEDKDGQKKYMTEIIGERIQLLGGRGDDTKRRDEPRSAAKDAPFEDGDSLGPDDDIPF